MFGSLPLSLNVNVDAIQNLSPFFVQGVQAPAQYELYSFL